MLAYKFAELLAQSKVTVPNELKGNVPDCMAIVINALQWNMNPLAVAQKAHIVGGKLGYESQLVHAVIKSSRAIDGGFTYEYLGDWSNILGNVVEKKGSNGRPYHASWLGKGRRKGPRRDRHSATT